MLCAQWLEGLSTGFTAVGSPVPARCCAGRWRDKIETIPALRVLMVQCRTEPEMDDCNLIPKLGEKCLPTVVLSHLG